MTGQSPTGQAQVYQLVYISVSTLGSRPEDIAEGLRDILTVSRAANHQMDITGALLFSGGRFAQILEGPQEPILSLMLRIQADTRHRNVTVVQELWVGGRDFGTWAMAFVDGSSARMIRLSPSIDFAGIPLEGRGKAILDMMKYLVSEEAVSG